MLIELTRRTLEENRYYWGVVVPALAQCWHLDKLDAHASVKLRFNCGHSTATLTTIRFEKMLERIRAYAWRVHGIEIPLPNSSAVPGPLSIA